MHLHCLLSKQGCLNLLFFCPFPVPSPPSPKGKRCIESWPILLQASWSTCPTIALKCTVNVFQELRNIFERKWECPVIHARAAQTVVLMILIKWNVDVLLWEMFGSLWTWEQKEELYRAFCVINNRNRAYPIPSMPKVTIPKVTIDFSEYLLKYFLAGHEESSLLLCLKWYTPGHHWIFPWPSFSCSSSVLK